jgi:hypothetical protein
VSTSNAAINPNALALNPRFPIKPTLGPRIHFVYCTSDCGCLGSMPHEPRAATSCAPTIR